MNLPPGITQTHSMTCQFGGKGNGLPEGNLTFVFIVIMEAIVIWSLTDIMIVLFASFVETNSTNTRKQSQVLKAGIIHLSSFPAVAGFFFVDKKDGSLRPCIDYCGLNDITVKNCYPLPLINSVFDQVQGKKIFIKLDLHNTHHPVQIMEG